MKTLLHRCVLLGTAMLALGASNVTKPSLDASERYRRLIPYMTFYFSQQPQQQLSTAPRYQPVPYMLVQPHSPVYQPPAPVPTPAPPPVSDTELRINALIRILSILQQARKLTPPNQPVSIQTLQQVLGILQHTKSIPSASTKLAANYYKPSTGTPKPQIQIYSNTGFLTPRPPPSAIPDILDYEAYDEVISPKPVFSVVPNKIPPYKENPILTSTISPLNEPINDIQAYGNPQAEIPQLKRPIQNENLAAYNYAPKIPPQSLKPYGGVAQGVTVTHTFPDPNAEGGTPGRPGVDYPILSIIPQTSFTCKSQRYKGFFGDPETACQVWHYCDLNGGQASFLCPNGTIFNQVALTCDWWFNVKCSSTAQLYVLNERLYKYILPVMPKFPEDFSGPLVDEYITMQFIKKEQERLEKAKNSTTTSTTTESLPIQADYDS